MIFSWQASCANTNPQDYVQYKSDNNSILDITFYYPREWQWQIEYKTENIFMMYATDPMNSESLGLVGIEVYEEKDKFTAQAEMDRDIDMLLRAGELQSNGLKMENFASKINDLNTVNINFEFLSNAISKAPLSIKETTFLLVDNKYYRLDITIPKELRNEKFGQGFDYLISTIQVSP